jgi:hypothetical protein
VSKVVVASPVAVLLPVGMRLVVVHLLPVVVRLLYVVVGLHVDARARLPVGLWLMTVLHSPERTMGYQTR